MRKENKFKRNWQIVITKEGKLVIFGLTYSEEEKLRKIFEPSLKKEDSLFDKISKYCG